MVFPVDSLISQWDKNHQLSGGILRISLEFGLFLLSVFFKYVFFMYIISEIDKRSQFLVNSDKVLFSSYRFSWLLFSLLTRFNHSTPPLSSYSALNTPAEFTEPFPEEM